MNVLLSFVRWSSSPVIYRQKRLSTRIRVSDIVPHIPGIKFCELGRKEYQFYNIRHHQGFFPQFSSSFIFLAFAYLSYSQMEYGLRQTQIYIL